jgi:hypothetical protein
MVYKNKRKIKCECELKVNENNTIKNKNKKGKNSYSINKNVINHDISKEQLFESTLDFVKEFLNINDEKTKKYLIFLNKCKYKLKQ